MKKTSQTRIGAGALLTILSATTAVHAAPGVTLNGQPLSISAPPQQINGRTMVPLRDIFEALGAPVEWNPVAQTIKARSGETQIQLGLNNPIALVNGRNVQLDQPATLVNGRAFVPLRFVAEATGAQVDWNQSMQLVSIRTLQRYVNPPLRVDNSLPYNAPTSTNAPLTNNQQVASFRQVSVPAGVVVPVTLDSALSSSSTRVGERFTATVVSRRLGDSEFPAGTKIEAVVTEARPSKGSEAGVLDFEFQTAVLPDGTRIPMRGQLASLDEQSVQNQNGRLVASGAKRDDRLKVIGIGAGAGFVLGRVLKADSTISTVLGAAGGYLFSRSRDRKAAEAQLAANTALGVELVNRVEFRDQSDYGRFRELYIRENNPRYSPTELGFDSRAAVRPTDNYDGYQVSETFPLPAQNGDVFANNDFGNNATQIGARTISIPAGAVVPVTLDSEISSSTARVGDELFATVETQRLGDSEFPAGTRLSGRVTEAQRQEGDQPGVLDLEWREAVLPSGERVSIRGQLVGLDEKSVQNRDGRIVARNRASNNNRLKVIGIGAGAGYVLGRVLGKDGLLPSLLGALGGYVFSAKQGDKPADARLAAGTRLGVRLDDRVAYNSDNYYPARTAFLQLN